MHMDELDEGWFLDEAPTRESSFIKSAPSLPNQTLELEADEPPEISFEDATREYHGPAAEFGAGQDNGRLLAGDHRREEARARVRSTGCAGCPIPASTSSCARRKRRGHGLGEHARRAPDER